jgi:hypothetical protein
MEKHQSGHQKRQRKEKEDELTKSQRGAMVKFVKRKSEVSSDNQSVDHSTLALAIVPYNETENNVEVEEDHRC